LQPTSVGCGRGVPGDTALAALRVQRVQHNEAGIRCRCGRVGVTIRDERIVRWDPRDLQALVELGQERRYRKGAYLMLQGDPLRTVHLFIEGWAKVVLTTAAGHNVLLTILGPADLVGDFEALGGVARSASVVALEPVTTRVVTDAQFLEYLAAHPQAALDLLRTFIHRIRVADRRRIEAGLLDTPHRLGSLLLMLAERHGRPTAHGTTIAIALSQEELSSMIGASRDSVTRALTALRSRGWVATSRRSMTLLDVGALRTFVAESDEWD
jgi:CRP/FNR family cyclic AMP-dependent transcriptional regulator